MSHGIGGHCSTRGNDTRHFSHALRRVGHKEDHQRHDREIEGGIWEGQGHGVGDHELDALQEWMLPGEGELRFRRVNADQRERFALLSDQLREGTIATAHIQPALAVAGGDPAEKVLAGEAAPDPHEAVVTGPIGEADRFIAHALGWDGVQGCTGRCWSGPY